jgi:hypothetical protein
MILLLWHLYLKNYKTLDILCCFRIENETPSALFFQIAFERKWQIGLVDLSRDKFLLCGKSNENKKALISFYNETRAFWYR